MKIRVTQRMVQSTGGIRKMRFFTEVEHCGKIDKENFVESIKNNKCIPIFWTLAVLEATSDYIMQMAKEGHIIEVPYFGLFKLSARGKTTDSKDDAGRKAIDKIRLNFRPTADILHDLETIQLQ